MTTLLIEAPSACGRQKLRNLRQTRLESLPVAFNNRFVYGSAFLLGSDKHPCKSVESRAVQPVCTENLIRVDDVMESSKLVE